MRCIIDQTEGHGYEGGIRLEMWESKELCPRAVLLYTQCNATKTSVDGHTRARDDVSNIELLS